MDRTLRTISPADRVSVVDDAIRDRHAFIRSNEEYWEFACRAKSSPLREHLALETFNEGVIHTNWDQGAGIDLSMCGYTTRLSVLIKLRDVALFRYIGGHLPIAFSVMAFCSITNFVLDLSLTSRSLNNCHCLIAVSSPLLR